MSTLDGKGSLYFAVSVFSTAELDDITPQVDIAGLVIMVQMFAEPRGQATQHHEPNP